MFSLFLFQPLGMDGWSVDTAVLRPLDKEPASDDRPGGTPVHIPPYGIRAQYDSQFTVVHIGFYGRTGALCSQPITTETIRIVESRLLSYSTVFVHAGVLHIMCSGQCDQASADLPLHHPLRALLTPFLRGVEATVVQASVRLTSSPGLFSVMTGIGTEGRARLRAVYDPMIGTQAQDIQDLLQNPHHRLRHLGSLQCPTRDMLIDAARWYDHFSAFSEFFVQKHHIVDHDPVVIRWKSRIGWARDMSVSQIITTLAFCNVVHAVVDGDRLLALLTRASGNIVYGPDGTSVLPGSRISTVMGTTVALLTSPLGYTFARLDEDYQPGGRYHTDFQGLSRLLRDEESLGMFRCLDLLPSTLDTSVYY
jgi:hypothetical protein